MGLCGRCKKAQATFHAFHISPTGEKSERHLCEPCAMAEGLVQLHKPEMQTDVVTGMIEKKSSVAAANAVCGECQISFLEFRNQGLLGCPDDYDAFRELLMPIIERAHDGAHHHRGKTPHAAATSSPRSELRKLRKQLGEAVQAEDYERAAALRDRMKELESQ